MRPHNHASIALTLLLLSLFFYGCSVPASPTPKPLATPAQPSPTPVTPTATKAPQPVHPDESTPQPAEWDGDYASVPPDLCPPGTDNLQAPVFEPEVREDPQREDERGWVRNGLVPNAQGELFGIEVAAANPDEVKAYTDEIQVCFDVVWGKEPLQPTATPPVEVIPPGAAGELTMLITFGFIGAVDPGASLAGDENPAAQGRADAAAKTMTARDAPVEEWETFLEKEFNVARADALAKEVKRQAVFDFVIDPSITGSAAPHQYKEKTGEGDFKVTVSVANGGGSVKATLCKITNGDSANVNNKTVTKGGTETSSMSFSSGRFDLGVDGLSNSNKYKVSGRWSRGYDNSAPSNSNYNCPP